MKKNDTQIIAGRFELGEKIGSGGFGQIYKGYEIESRAEVAIKFVYLQIINRR